MFDVVDVVFVVTSGPRLLWNFVKIETDTTIAAYELMVVSNGSYVCNGGQRTFSMVRTDFFSVVRCLSASSETSAVPSVQYSTRGEEQG